MPHQDPTHPTDQPKPRQRRKSEEPKLILRELCHQASLQGFRAWPDYEGPRMIYRLADAASGQLVHTSKTTREAAAFLAGVAYGRKEKA